MSDLEWMTRAACKDADTEIFFPPDHMALPLEAARVCWSCPVKTTCLTYAYEHPELQGVWGATTTRQRNAMRIHAERKYRRRVLKEGEYRPGHCGTATASKAHYARGEKPCRPCRAAIRLYNREKRQAKNEG